MKYFLITFETRHFDFTGLVQVSEQETYRKLDNKRGWRGEDKIHALARQKAEALMLKAWEEHCKTTDADPEYMEECIDDIGVQEM